MHPLVSLLGKQEFRTFSTFPFRSMGYMNFAKSTFQATLKNEDGRRNLPRHLLPTLWRNLGERKAIVSHNGTITFEQLSERALRLSNSFHKLGLTGSDKIATLMLNEQGWFDVMLANMLSGIRMPMLNTHLKAAEIEQCIINSDPKILVISKEFLDLIHSIDSHLTGVLYIIIAGVDKVPASYPDKYLALEELIETGDAHLDQGRICFPQMPFSGGSTGVPKFIVEGGNYESEQKRRKGVSKQDYTHLKSKLLYGFSLVSASKVKGQVVSLIPGPLYHAGVQVAVLPLYFGGTVVPMHKFDAEDFLRLIEREKVNFTFVAPTMLERVLKLPAQTTAKYDLSSMQVIFCAAAPCAEYVKRDINTLFKRQGAKGNVFHEYYGSSESAAISVLYPEHYEEKPERYKSVGKIAGCDVLIYDPETQTKCSPGEDGHVLVRNARMYKVNYGNSTDMDNAFIEVDGVYWFDDGCIGHLDEDGFLYLTSRSKDMIISGGVNIFPVEIEEVMKQHPALLDVVVVKVPDPDLGEVPGALVMTIDGKELTKEALLAYCKANGLYGYKMPRHIKFVDQIPKNSAGKVRKKDLEGEFDDCLVATEC